MGRLDDPRLGPKLLFFFFFLIFSYIIIIIIIVIIIIITTIIITITIIIIIIIIFTARARHPGLTRPREPVAGWLPAGSAGPTPVGPRIFGSGGPDGRFFKHVETCRIVNTKMACGKKIINMIKYQKSWIDIDTFAYNIS